MGDKKTSGELNRYLQDELLPSVEESLETVVNDRRVMPRKYMKAFGASLDCKLSILQNIVNATDGDRGSTTQSDSRTAEEYNSVIETLDNINRESELSLNRIALMKEQLFHLSKVKRYRAGENKL